MNGNEAKLNQAPEADEDCQHPALVRSFLMVQDRRRTV